MPALDAAPAAPALRSPRALRRASRPGGIGWRMGGALPCVTAPFVLRHAPRRG